MSKDKLGMQVVSGLSWTYAERILAQGVSLLVTVILARLLSPDDFGAITIITIFINIANVFAVEGFGNALIQKKEIDERDYSSVFFFNMLFSAFVYSLIFYAAPYIASFYRMPILKTAIRVMGIRIILAGINSVQQAYISRNMLFKKFFISTLFGTCISAVVGVIMAYKGFGIWALVTQYLCNALIDTVILSITSGLRIHFLYSQKRLNILLAYSWKLVVSSLLISIYSNARDLIIGKQYSSKELAFYNKGNQFPSYIASNINTSISKVLFPALSSFQDEKEDLKRLTRRSISVGVYVLTPILMGLATVSNTFVKVVLTEQWNLCIPFLQIYCFIFMLQPIQTSSLQMMKAIGRSDLYLKLEIIKKIFGLVILAVSVLLFKNLILIALGALLCELFSTILNFPVNKKILKYSYREQLSDIVKPFFISIIMCLAVHNVENFIYGSWIALGIFVFVGIIVYILLSVLFRIKEFEYIKKIIISIIFEKKGEKNEQQ